MDTEAGVERTNSRRESAVLASPEEREAIEERIGGVVCGWVDDWLGLACVCWGGTDFESARSRMERMLESVRDSRTKTLCPACVV